MQQAQTPEQPNRESRGAADPTARTHEFVLLGVLGRGSQGTVYLARSAASPDSPEIALKVVSPSTDDAACRARDEAQIMRYLFELGAGIVQVRALYQRQGARQIAIEMELVRGRTLDGMLREQGPVDADGAIEIGLRMAEVLTFCHGTGVINRDLKPENILIDEDGRVLPIDFGTCLWDGERREAVTELGNVMGTIPFMAPEIFLHALNMHDDEAWSLTEKVDVYALGATLFQVMTGQTLNSDDLAARVRRLKQGSEEQRNVDRVLELDAPASLKLLLTRMVAQDPASRPSARSIVAALRELRSGGTPLQHWLADASFELDVEPLDASGNRVMRVGRSLPWVHEDELLQQPGVCRSEMDTVLFGPSQPDVQDDEADEDPELSDETLQPPAMGSRPWLPLVERVAYLFAIGVLAAGCVVSFAAGWMAGTRSPEQPGTQSIAHADVDLPDVLPPTPISKPPPVDDGDWQAELESAVFECHRERSKLRRQLVACGSLGSDVSDDYEQLQADFARSEKKYDILMSTLEARVEQCESDLGLSRAEVDGLESLAECGAQFKRCRDLVPAM